MRFRRRRPLPPGWIRYRSKRREFTADEKETLARWREEARQRAYEKLRERYGD